MLTRSLAHSLTCSGLILMLASCGDGVSYGLEPDLNGAQRAEPVVATAQQVAYWSAWLEARVPADHVRAQLTDSEGFAWDCVDIAHQPAFRHKSMARARRAAELVDDAALKNVVISDDEVAAQIAREFSQASPVSDISESDANRLLAVAFAEMDEDTETNPSSDDPDRTEVTSHLDISGECPSGTVPIEAWDVTQIAKYGSLDAFLSPEPPLPPAQVDHFYAVIRDEGTFSGGMGNINIWDPYVQRNTEFSLAQIWLSRGVLNDLQTLEAGWQDYYHRTLSHKPRLFVYSTSKNYQALHGCYNNACGRWVHTNSSIPLNTTWSTFSTDGGAQYSDTYKYWRASNTGNWYFVFNGQTVGYYPSHLFDAAGLLNSADIFDIGGEVTDQDLIWQTGTDMGSGKFPSAGWTHAAYVRNVRSKVGTTYQDFTVVHLYNKLNCYDVAPTLGSSWGMYAYFGGPGYQNPNCTQ